MDLIIITICFLALLIGSYSDWKTREVPDWLNYSLIISGIGLRLIFSIGNNDFSILYEGLIGLGVCVAFAYLMFYTGQWGGGDSKLIMGLGSLLGLEFNLNHILVSFFINTMIVGALFGILYALFIAIINKKKFLPKFKKENKKYLKYKIAMFCISLILLTIAIITQIIEIKIMLSILAITITLTFYMWIFIKVVEDSCMIKDVDISQVTEGDWIPKDIFIDKKKICGPSDLGISRKQIKKLIEYKNKGKIKKIPVKYGMPFVPAFLGAFIVTVFVGNILFSLI